MFIKTVAVSHTAGSLAHRTQYIGICVCRPRPVDGKKKKMTKKEKNSKSKIEEIHKNMFVGTFQLTLR